MYLLTLKHQSYTYGNVLVRVIIVNFTKGHFHILNYINSPKLSLFRQFHLKIFLNFKCCKFEAVLMLQHSYERQKQYNSKYQSHYLSTYLKIASSKYPDNYRHVRKYWVKTSRTQSMRILSSLYPIQNLHFRK